LLRIEGCRGTAIMPRDRGQDVAKRRADAPPLTRRAAAQRNHDALRRRRSAIMTRRAGGATQS
jgi:hypothetical protein